MVVKAVVVKVIMVVVGSVKYGSSCGSGRSILSNMTIRFGN